MIVQAYMITIEKNKDKKREAVYRNSVVGLSGNKNINRRDYGRISRDRIRHLKINLRDWFTGYDYLYVVRLWTELGGTA